MAAKRPSYPSIRARQRNLLEYQFSTDKTYRQAARELGVKPSEFERFVTANPRSLRQQYNRSKMIRKLYGEGERPDLRKKAKAQGVKLERLRTERGYRVATQEVPIFERDYQARLGRTQELIAALYERQRGASYDWAVFAAEENIPVSIKVIKLMWRNGEIDSSRYDYIIAVWKTIYNIETAEAA